MGNIVEIDGLEDLTQDFRKLAKAFSPDQIEKAALEGAEVIRAQAEKNAPRGPTGNLKDAQIKRTLSKGKITSAVAATDRVKAPHGYLVEKGTSHSKAQPYFRDAVCSKSREAAERFERALERMINEAVR